MIVLLVQQASFLRVLLYYRLQLLLYQPKEDPLFLIEFIIPRLEVFISIYSKVVVDEENYIPKLKSILERFKAYKENSDLPDEKTIEDTTQAWHDFADLFFGLWW